MSRYTNKTTMMLLRMLENMMDKNIEISRISKCATQLLFSGLEPEAIPDRIKQRLLETQNEDGGFVAVPDTMWNVAFLSFFPQFRLEREKAVRWLGKQKRESGLYGRGSRDMERIPVSGILFSMIPELVDNTSLQALEQLWMSELDSLTYKAAYTLLAMKENDYTPKKEHLIYHTVKWLEEQQESNGGFAPWKGHAVGTNIYCTAVSVIALAKYPEISDEDVLKRSYEYMKDTQLDNGLWPYHEIEDGAAWGLRAMTVLEGVLEENKKGDEIV